MENQIEVLQNVLKNDPSNFQARRELSILLADNGFNEEALSNLNYLVKYFPEDSELFYNLGILYEKLKNFEKAKESYLKAIEISPQEDFYYNLGEVLVSLQEWDEAVESFKFVLSKDKNDSNCYFNLGLCYFNKEEFNLATDNFQKAVELNPQDVFAHFYLGYIYQNNGLTNFAIKSYQKVLEISPDYSWAYFNLASIAYKNENVEQAKEYLLKTIQYNNGDIEAYKLLTKICIKESEFEEIISILETRLEKEENGDLYYILAQVYKFAQNEKECLKNIDLAIKNRLTLSYPLNIVKNEREYLSYKFPEEDISYEEYRTEDEFEVSDEDSDEDLEPEFEDEDEFETEDSDMEDEI